MEGEDIGLAFADFFGKVIVEQWGPNELEGEGKEAKSEDPDILVVGIEQLYASSRQADEQSLV